MLFISKFIGGFFKQDRFNTSEEKIGNNIFNDDIKFKEQKIYTRAFSDNTINRIIKELLGYISKSNNYDPYNTICKIDFEYNKLSFKIYNKENKENNLYNISFDINKQKLDLIKNKKIEKETLLSFFIFVMEQLNNNINLEKFINLLSLIKSNKDI